MPQSLSNVLIHLVFSTKDRHPCLSDDIQAHLFPYLGGILRNIDCIPIQIGGVEDHVHILYKLPRTLALSQMVEKTKTASTKWLKTQGLESFAWQSGYGAWSVSAGDAESVIHYIQTQKEHHRKVSFQEELRALLKEAGMEFDERYLWD